MGVLSTLLDDNGESRRKIGSLLTNLRALVVETPKDGRDDLGEIRLDSDT